MRAGARVFGVWGALLLAALIACGGGDGGDDVPAVALDLPADPGTDAGGDPDAPPLPCQDPRSPGPYAVGFDDLLLPDPQRGGDLHARVHYPATVAGQGTEPDRSHAPWPLVILSHGFLLTPGAFDPLAAHLASHGFVVLAPTHRDSIDYVAPRLVDACAAIPKAEQWARLGEGFRMLLEPDHAHRRVGDVSALIDDAQALQGGDGPLAGMLDLTRVGFAGHSFGAFTGLIASGATLHVDHVQERCLEEPTVADIMKMGIMPFLTCQVLALTSPEKRPDRLTIRDPRVKALVEMAGPVEVLWGPAFEGFGTVEVPLMALFTTTDEAVPFDTGPALLADALPAPAYLLAFAGGNHGNFGAIDFAHAREVGADVPADCGLKQFVYMLGGDADDRPELPMADQHLFVRAAAAAFLQAHLAGATGCEPYLDASYYQGLHAAFTSFETMAP